MLAGGLPSISMKPTEILISLLGRVLDRLCETLLEFLEYGDRRKVSVTCQNLPAYAHGSDVLLSKPSFGHNGKLLPQLPKVLWAVKYHHHGLLYRRTCHFGGSIDQFVSVELSGTGDAEERGRSCVRGCFVAECKVRKLLDRAEQ